MSYQLDEFSAILGGWDRGLDRSYRSLRQRIYTGSRVVYKNRCIQKHIKGDDHQGHPELFGARAIFLFVPPPPPPHSQK